MANEPSKLSEARALLARFESEMEQPEGLVYLSEALSLLDDIRADSESEDVKQVTSRLPLLYAQKVQERVEPLLSNETIHWDTVKHWQKVFQEFENFDFTLPQDVAETRLKLLMKKMEREVGLMSPAERKNLLEQLQDIKDK